MRFQHFKGSRTRRTSRAVFLNRRRFPRIPLLCFAAGLFSLIATIHATVVFAQDATASEETEDLMELIRKLDSDYGKSPEESFELASLAMLNWNEFIFVD